ncbi:cytochrome b/b6 domain-containing protein [uncultured Sphingomonas sp.]|uniref:cytochrome b/b6 domain-containing protein n=1 Tax=uncultured Sphingomonas sp. TaxID=158754 RepID=UPI00258681E7|nr:cytochrome b/b6 domain-containing protein [uncultured Sphingomonas sp.]
MTTGTTRAAPLWDVPVRLFHWLLVALIAFSWWSGENHEMEWHRTSGYVILALVVFRLFWGVAGGRTARFARFVRGPRVVIAYVRGGASATPGHNPLGGWSVVAMLATVAAMVTAGVFAVDVDGLESGPLADYVTFDQGRMAAEWHGAIFNLLLALIALHVAAVLVYLVRGRNLIGAMIHGRRAVVEGEAVEPLGASWWRALLGVAIAGAVAWAVSRGFRF